MSQSLRPGLEYRSLSCGPGVSSAWVIWASSPTSQHSGLPCLRRPPIHGWTFSLRIGTPAPARTACERWPKFLARQNKGRYHMGATGKNPVNNRPFLGGPGRIDEFTKISRKARPSFELLHDCLVDLNRMSGEEAQAAFVAWLRVRMEVQRVKLVTDMQLLATTTGLDVAALIDTAERFVREDTEGGRRGQAFVAAVLDCAFSDVVLQAINDPNPGDVRVRDHGRTAWIVEVKQVAADESTAFALASEAQSMSVTLALLVVLADRQSPLDREQIRRRAIREHKVLLEVAESIRELIGMVAVFSMTTIEQIAESLPGRYALRIRDHGVSEAAQRRWSELMEARTK